MTESLLKSPNIYNIDSGESFARRVVRSLILETVHDPEILATYSLLLPTRRACRIVAEMFLEESGGRATLLPKMQPIGQIEEDELSLALVSNTLKNADFQEFLDLKPGISPLRRQIFLARLILARGDFPQGPDHAFRLAGALGRLLDQVHTEGLKLEDLRTIVPEHCAAHWQITLDFLAVISIHWPRILQDDGAMDLAARREALIRTLARLWEQRPPQTPIIAAGTTGSIPATADLLRVVSMLPQGRVVLPGFDAGLDDDSWAAMTENHPQYGFRLLLERMGARRSDVQAWPVQNDDDAGKRRQARRFLAREMMRPAQTTSGWQALGQDPQKRDILAQSLENLHIIETVNEREEAAVIGLIIRETLETPSRRVAVITPDRGLARRVASICRRWEIAVDDSAGLPLDQSPVGEFLILAAQAALAKISPVAFLALCKHEYFTAGLRVGERQAALAQLEITALRGPKPAAGFEGLRQRLEAAGDAEKACVLIDTIAPLMADLIAALTAPAPQDFGQILSMHMTLCEALSAREDLPDGGLLWRGEAGEQAAQLLSQILQESPSLPPMRGPEYLESLKAMLQTVTVRVSYGLHPRVRILGQIEARMVDADRVILGGLNEGTWPADSGHDPWMSRRMRGDFGLPSTERGIGLAAHDFVQGLCASEVFLTRARRAAGVATVPSRWLQRLETTLQAAALDARMVRQSPYCLWSQMLDAPAAAAPWGRPMPQPPARLRPRKLSVTAIETWLEDPYSIYARYILRLRKLKPLEKPLEADDKGTLLHKVLKRFTDEFPKDIPPDAAARLRAYARAEMERERDDPAVWQFWWPRFENAAQWLVGHESDWRRAHSILGTEIEGRIDIALDPQTPPFTLTAKADRIDRGPEGAVIIDYKSGGTYTKTSIQEGWEPQLALEALILNRGGFQVVPSTVQTGALAYWKLTGGQEPGKEIMVNFDTKSIVEKSEEGLMDLIRVFSAESTAYIAIPNASRLPRFHDYEHLARVREWTALGDADAAEEGA